MKRLFFYLLMVLLSLPIGAQTKKQLTNLPTLYIQTSGSEAVTSKKTFISGTLTIVDGEQQEVLTGMRIRCRGNSTFSGAGATKKAYRLKFTKPVSLLGDKGVTDVNWVLMANHYDKSLIRPDHRHHGSLCRTGVQSRRTIRGCRAERNVRR